MKIRIKGREAVASLCMIFVSYGVMAASPDVQEYNRRLNQILFPTLREITGERCWPLMKCIKFDAQENTNFNERVRKNSEWLYYNKFLTMPEVEAEYVKAIRGCVKTSGLIELIS